MAEIGIVLSVAQTLFAALQCSQLKEACSAWNYESQLEDLKSTVVTVQSVLIDAGNKTALSQTHLNYINKLKDAVYDADDLFDEFITLAELKKQNGNLLDKVHYFFSSQNPIKVAYSIFRDVKKIRNHLNAIADDQTKFGSSVESVDTQPLRRRREETCGYVYAQDGVGRDGDASKVIKRLQDSNDDIGFLTIVGIGGIGKTTLAKLVLGDKRIKFGKHLRLWVCVSDQDRSSLDIKEILAHILVSAGFMIDNSRSTTIEYVQSEFQRKLKGKKFLLVLDDIWTEDLFEWNKLREFLMIGGKGSRIVATTRSITTAKIIGNNIHELEGLSRENSCLLFQMAAFQNRSSIPFDYVDISEKIIEKCCDLPLAIKVVGSLLYGQPIDKWETFEKNGFAGISNGENKVMSILKNSYDHLEPSLKSCFAYCALFPKDYVIDKEKLIILWEAQGYIVPFDKDQSIENAGEEHFSILLKRCFFQDVKKNEYGDVVSFKIHDLMHDLAQKVAHNEICVTHSTMTIKDYKIARHLLEVRPNVGDNYVVRSKIRSYLSVCTPGNTKSLPLGKIAKNWVCLRALSLENQAIQSYYPAIMDNLVHLRYLSLAYNSRIMELPDSIANLHNLQILNLNYCNSLKEWPQNFSKLVNLTHLYIDGCYGLKHMPVGMSRLTRLRVLTEFKLNDGQHVGQLKDIKAFAVNLKGRIVIRLYENFKSSEGYDWVDRCLEGAENLKEVVLDIFHLDKFGNGYKEMSDEERVKGEAVIERLKPHPNLKYFELRYNVGEKIHGWGSAQDNWATSLPNLIHIKLWGCYRLQQLPVLSKLKYLKSLHLSCLLELEYMEEDLVTSSSWRRSLWSRKHEITFFPSLECLTIWKLPKLKGWWKSGNNKMRYQPGFPRLSELTIRECCKLTSFPPCPKVKRTL